MVSDKSVLRYPGGKFRARKIIESYLPENTTHILSPFFGGGSFELYMTGKKVSVTAYDKFYVLAVFWEELSKRPQALATSVQKYFGRVDSALFKQLQQELKYIDEAKVTQDSLDTAAKFFVVNRCSFSGATLSGGFSKESARTRFTQSIIDRLDSWDNDYLTFSYGDCHNVLEDVSDDVDALFLDPPYLLEKDKNTLYGVSGNMHKDFDHILFFDQVNKLDKPFVLTYNNSDVVRDIWKDYFIYDAQWAYGMNKDKKSSEIIVTNFKAQEESTLL